MPNEENTTKPMSLDVALAILSPVMKRGKPNKLPELAKAWEVITARLEEVAAKPAPRLVISMDGGLIHNIQGDCVAHVIVIDEDTEGVADSDVSEIDGDDVYISHWALTDESAVVERLYEQARSASDEKGE